jgi:hypothetical protein
MRSTALAIPVLALLPACGAPRYIDPGVRVTEEVSLQLAWLDASTTREDVLMRLGAPYVSLEDGRILCFLLQPDQGGVLVAAERTGFWPRTGFGSWEAADYDLVVVFGEDGRVARSSLRRIREP